MLAADEQNTDRSSHVMHGLHLLKKGCFDTVVFLNNHSLGAPEEL